MNDDEAAGRVLLVETLMKHKARVYSMASPKGLIH